MKKIVTLIALPCFTVIVANTTTWTVSNNPDIPGQFGEISEAVTSPSTTQGDTILVAGSSTQYANFTLNKPYVIIGAGINNPYGEITWVNNVKLATTAGFSPSGTRLIGLWIDSYFSMDAYEGSQTIENVVIERCWLDSYVYFNGYETSTFRNDTIRNCMMEDYYMQFDEVATYESIMIHNNLFDNAIFDQETDADLANVTVKNNVFINESSDVFGGINNMVVENNIFFKASPQGCTGCNFLHNTSYGATNNVLPGSGNIGTENYVRDPRFINYTDADADYTFEAGYDFHLNTDLSSEDGTGTGGTDRGMYGGPMPVELGSNPAIPQMTEVSFPDNASSVEEGGTLNVRFKARKQD